MVGEDCLSVDLWAVRISFLRWRTPPLRAPATDFGLLFSFAHGHCGKNPKQRVFESGEHCLFRAGTRAAGAGRVGLEHLPCGAWSFRRGKPAGEGFSPSGNL